MNSTPPPKAIEPNNPLIVRADEQIARAYEKIGQADEQLARVTEQLAKLGLEAAPPPAAAPAAPPLPGRPVRRAHFGWLLLAGIVVAALFLQSFYSGRVRLIVARWAPQFVSTSALTPEASFPAQPAPSAVQAAVAVAAPPGAAPSAQAAPSGGTPLAQTAPPHDATPTAAAAVPDLTQLSPTIARDLANVQRDIEQLRANQQQITSDNSRTIEQLTAIQKQMASDNSRAIEQLKASQEEMKRQLAVISERNLSKTSPPPTPPTVSARKPKQRPYPPYERALRRIPDDWGYDEW